MTKTIEPSSTVTPFRGTGKPSTKTRYKLSPSERKELKRQKYELQEICRRVGPYKFALKRIAQIDRLLQEKIEETNV